MDPLQTGRPDTKSIKLFSDVSSLYSDWLVTYKSWLQLFLIQIP